MHLAEHLVATTRGRVRRLLEPELASWLWSHLAVAVPDALSNVLMPDHLHMMALPGRYDAVRKTLNGFTCSFGIRMDLQLSQRASTPAILGRQIRYGFYNPVRAGFVADPWQWPWSTLRDLGGACYPIWTELRDVANELRLNRARAMLGMTHLGHQRPPAPQLREVEVASAYDLRSAVAGTLRLTTQTAWHTRDGRRLAVQLAGSLQREVPTRVLADILEMGPRSVRRLRRPEHPALPAAMLCLGDARLRRPIDAE